MLATYVSVLIPVVGLAVGAYLLAHGVALAWAIVDAAGTGQGIMIQANTFWCVIKIRRVI